MMSDPVKNLYAWNERTPDNLDDLIGEIRIFASVLAARDFHNSAQRCREVTDVLASALSRLTAERDEAREVARMGFHEKHAALFARAEAAEAQRDSLREALVRADQFISNGIELGFIRMPDPQTPDAAHETPGLIKRALSSLNQEAGNV